jgi:hypothetical protein
MMMCNIYFFIVTLTSLFSSAQPFIPPRFVNKNKLSNLIERPIKDVSKDNICNECKYFIADEQKCRLFYNVDLVNGKEYDRAIDVRKSNNKCGIDGVYFEKNKFLFVKEVLDILTRWYPLFFTCAYVILYVFILNYKYK